MTETVRSELRGPVRWVTLDNPEKKNALDRTAIASLGDAFRASDADDETRVVVLTGRGQGVLHRGRSRDEGNDLVKKGTR